MSKKLIIMFLISLLIFAGMGVLASAEFKWPDSLIYGTYDVGGGPYTTVTAYSPILEKLTGMKVRVIPGSPTTAYKDLIAGKIDLATFEGMATIFNHEGRGGASIYPKGQIRLVYMLMDSPLFFYTAADSKIETIYDLKKGGFKVAVAVSDPGDQAICEDGLPAFLGLTREEADKLITWVKLGSWGEQTKAAIEGTADVSCVPAASASAYEYAASPRGIRVLDMPLSDKEGWERWLAIEPGFMPGECTYGVDEALGHDMFIGYYLITALVDTDEEMIYQLTKWHNENYDGFKDQHPNCARIRMDSFRSFLDISPFPVHEGTIRYLREIGKWTVEDDKWNEEAIDLMEKYIEAWDNAAAEAKSKNIEISVANQQWLDLYDGYKRDLPPIVPRL